jgi:hypothetical protein
MCWDTGLRGGHSRLDIWSTGRARSVTVMNSEVVRAFKEALLESASVVRELLPKFLERGTVWSRDPSDSCAHRWIGNEVLLPNWRGIDLAASRALIDIAQHLTKVFAECHPEYAANFTLGRRTTLISAGSKAHLVMHAIRVLFDRHQTLDLDANLIDGISMEFSQFIEARAITVRYSAQLLNFTMEGDRIDLANGVTIERLSDREVSEILGHGDRRSFRRGVHECALVCDCIEPKVFGTAAADAARNNKTAGDKFDRALLALRTFKSGHVGYEQVRGQTVKFCPFDISEYGHRDLFVPLGSYKVSPQEAHSLEQHAAAIVPNHEPAMEMACSRLADAETRLRAEDRLVDAVIGLEAILLASLSGESRGELQFRFAMNYSTLGRSAEERHRYFRVAKGLYVARSTIAHGGNVHAKEFKIDKEPLRLPNVADLACDVLRSVIKRFLRESPAATYKEHQYWERRYFGTDASSANHG